MKSCIFVCVIDRVQGKTYIQQSLLSRIRKIYIDIDLDSNTLSQVSGMKFRTPNFDRSISNVDLRRALVNTSTTQYFVAMCFCDDTMKSCIFTCIINNQTTWQKYIYNRVSSSDKKRVFRCRIKKIYQRVETISVFWNHIRWIKTTC